MSEVSRRIALSALKMGAIELRPDDPFTWVSGYRMPIYNDNRLLLSEFENRRLVTEAFLSIARDCGLDFDVVAGTATAGIAPALGFADAVKSRFCYVRKASKGHGTKSRIEGLVNPGDDVLLVEDLISTGGSSLDAVRGLRAREAKVEHCFAIFSYGFSKATKAFEDEGCSLHVALGFPELLEVACEGNFINSEQADLLSSWSRDPFSWGEAHGFPKVEK